MVMVREEFSFPAIFSSGDDLSHQSANTVSSSSLWRISSKAKVNLNDEFGGRRRKIFRRSFCNKGEDYYYYYYYYDDDHGGISDAYSMDLLWENFNEENRSESLSETGFEEGIERNALGDANKDINVFKTSKKQRMVTVLKAVKKLILLGNLTRLKRRELDS